MSLKPKAVNFDDTWKKIEKTLNSVITLGETSSAEEMEQKRADWKDRFSYPFQKLLSCVNKLFQQKLVDCNSYM